MQLLVQLGLQPFVRVPDLLLRVRSIQDVYDDLYWMQVNDPYENLTQDAVSIVRCLKKHRSLKAKSIAMILRWPRPGAEAPYGKETKSHSWDDIRALKALFELEAQGLAVEKLSANGSKWAVPKWP